VRAINRAIKFLRRSIFPQRTSDSQIMDSGADIHNLVSDPIST